MNKTRMPIALILALLLVLTSTVNAQERKIISPRKNFSDCQTGYKYILYSSLETDWTPRSLELYLSFLVSGNFEEEIYKEGINADVNAADYTTEKLQVAANDKLIIKMAPGGGWVGCFTRK